MSAQSSYIMCPPRPQTHSYDIFIDYIVIYLQYNKYIDYIVKANTERKS